jgi:hypothetical protein
MRTVSLTLCLILVLGATGAYGDHSDQAAWDGSESNAWSYDNNWFATGSPSRPPDADDRVNIGTDKKYFIGRSLPERMP